MKIKKILILLCTTTLIMTSCNSIVEDPVETGGSSVDSTELKDDNVMDFLSVFSEKAEKAITLQDIEKIHETMTLGEVVDILGHPQRDIGSGAIILEWDMPDGQSFSITIDSSHQRDNVYNAVVTSVGGIRAQKES